MFANDRTKEQSLVASRQWSAVICLSFLYAFSGDEHFPLMSAFLLSLSVWLPDTGTQKYTEIEADKQIDREKEEEAAAAAGASLFTGQLQHCCKEERDRKKKRRKAKDVCVCACLLVLHLDAAVLVRYYNYYYY